MSYKSSHGPVPERVEVGVAGDEVAVLDPAKEVHSEDGEDEEEQQHDPEDVPKRGESVDESFEQVHEALDAMHETPDARDAEDA